MGIRSIVHEPNPGNPRERRNAHLLASGIGLIAPGEPLEFTGDGLIFVLAASGGLSKAGGELTINLDTDSGLSLSGDGITVLTQGVLALDASGVKLNIGTGLENDGADNLQVDEDAVDHDALSNFVANEHIDHSSVTITAGTGLSGGGDITTSRTLNLDAAVNDLSDVTITTVGDNEILAFDSGSNSWVNQTAAEAGLVSAGHTHTLSDITDSGTAASEDTGTTSGTIAILTTGGVFADARISSSSVAQHEGSIDHDALTNFVADEHIDHSSVTLTAGNGLTGGGDITTNRSFAVDLVTNGGLAFTTGQLEVDESNVDHDALSGFVANEHVDHSSVSLAAGDGLTGGGDITANRSFAVDLVASGGLSFTTGQLGVDEANVDHDALSNFVANEHIDHSSVTITAGTGLSGGGDITTSRTLNLDAAVNDLSDVTITMAGDEDVLAFDSGSGNWINQTAAEAGLAVVGHTHTLSDITDSGTAAAEDTGTTDGTIALLTTGGVFADGRISSSSVTQHEGSIDHDALTNFVAGEHFLQSAITETGTVSTGTWASTVSGATIDGDNNTVSNLDIGNEVDWAAAADVTDRSAAPASGDKLILFEAGVGLRKIDWDDLPSGGGSSPLTTKGDLYTYDTADARLPVGTDDQFLIADSSTGTGLAWQDQSAIDHDALTNFVADEHVDHSSTFITSSDTSVLTVDGGAQQTIDTNITLRVVYNSTGGGLFGGGSGLEVSLGPGMEFDGNSIVMNISNTGGLGLDLGNQLEISEITTEGDLLAGDSGGDPTRLPVGSDGEILTADSTAGVGLRWSATPVPPGVTVPFAGSTTPSGYLECDGSAVSRSTYADLFSAIGGTWGVGDGSTTFNLPDLRGRAAIGSGTGSGLTARSVGDTGGEEEHQLTQGELALHVHGSNSGNLVSSSGAGGAALAAGSGYTQIASTSATGNDEAHNNMQPFAALKWIIKT